MDTLTIEENILFSVLGKVIGNPFIKAIVLDVEV